MVGSIHNVKENIDAIKYIANRADISQKRKKKIQVNEISKYILLLKFIKPLSNKFVTQCCS